MIIFKEKILYESARYVADKMHLQVEETIADHIGNKGYIFKDPKGRRYYFACKRKMDFSKKPAIISFSKDIVKGALIHKCILLMFIEEGKYIYMFDPKTILTMPEMWENTFNDQVMVNFPIDYCMNAEPTRSREDVLIKVNLAQKEEKAAKEKEEKGKLRMTLKRFI